MRNCSNLWPWVAALAALFSGSACGATIHSFIIVNNSSLSAAGGGFPDGGTYSRWVRFDTDQIGPGNNNVEFPLASFDMVLKGSIDFRFNSAAELMVLLWASRPRFRFSQMGKSTSFNSPSNRKVRLLSWFCRSWSRPAFFMAG